MEEENLENNRCDCGKLLFKSLNLCGRIEIKCRRCGKIKVIERTFADFFSENVEKLTRGGDDVIATDNVLNLNNFDSN